MKSITTYIRALSLGSAFLFLFLITACQSTGSIEELAVMTPLPEIAQPTYADGYRVSAMRNGEDDSMLLVSQTDTTETWKSNDGCSWTRLKSGFAPELQWSGCEYADGVQEVKLTSETPYPLHVGKTWSYSLSGKNAKGEFWDGKRNCEVTSAVRITIVSGEYDTLKVVCTDAWRIRTWHVSPELNLVVRYVRKHKRRSSDIIVWEIVEVVSEGNST